MEPSENPSFPFPYPIPPPHKSIALNARGIHTTVANTGGNHPVPPPNTHTHQKVVYTLNGINILVAQFHTTASISKAMLVVVL